MQHEHMRAPHTEHPSRIKPPATAVGVAVTAVVVVVGGVGDGGFVASLFAVA